MVDVLITGGVGTLTTSGWAGVPDDGNGIVYRSLSGTSQQTLRLSRRGPTLRKGLGPPELGRNGDIYFRHGDDAAVYIRENDQWRLTNEISSVRQIGEAGAEWYVMSHITYFGVVDGAAAETVLHLPEGVRDRQIIIKDQTGVAGDNYIYIEPTAGQTIDGAASYAIQEPYGSVALIYSDGWQVVNAVGGGIVELTPIWTTITGTGSDDSFTVTHGLNTRDVDVDVVEGSGDREDITVTISRPNDNQVLIEFAAPPSLGVTYRVRISK